MTAKSINLALQNAFWSIKEIKEILCYTSFVYIFTQEIPSAMNTIIVESCKNFFVRLSNQPQAKTRPGDLVMPDPFGHFLV